MTDMQDMKPTNGVKIIKATKPAKVKTTAATNDQEKEILRVAAYCRVSTDSDEQENSYEAQCSYYHRYISSNPKWELAGIFADEGITGTMVRNRKQFQAMIRACEEGKIDMIITKSLSRFSRNTVDCLLTVRRLKELGIPVIFEKEGFNTEVTSGEMMLTFMSSFAQQESESISENVKMGLQMNAKAGKGQLNITHFLGYDRGDEPHSMVINPEQAEVVRRIYRLFLEGYSSSEIARQLQTEGIPTPSGAGNWHHTTITSILRNEKYCGMLIIQKYYTPNFLTHRSVKNTGQLPMYFIENDHDPIVPKAVFLQTQAELKRRAIDNAHFPMINKVGLGGKLICGRCGTTLKRYARSNSSQTNWRCRQRAFIKAGDSNSIIPRCDCRIVKETEIEQSIIDSFNLLRSHYEELVRKQEAINGDLRRIDSLLQAEEDHQDELKELKKKFAGQENNESISIMGKIQASEAKVDTLYAQRAQCAHAEMQVRMLLELVLQMLCKGNAGYRSMIKLEVPADGSACGDYGDFFVRTRYVLPNDIFDERGYIVKYANELTIRYIEKITVLDDGYEVQFKAGITLTV